jgi:hypothetical protein
MDENGDASKAVARVSTRRCAVTAANSMALQTCFTRGFVNRR